MSFNYFSNAKDDIAKIINSKYGPSAGSPETPAVSITSGLFAKGDNSYLDAISQWKTSATTLHRDGKAISVLIDRIEPARAKTFAEARGTVINEYQSILEKQWLAQLRQTYPVNVNDEEIKKLVK